MQITKIFAILSSQDEKMDFFYILVALSFLSAQERAVLCCPLWTGVLPLLRSLIVLFLTDLLQQFLLDQFELHAHRHLGDELLAAFLGHLFAVSQVNVTDASTALEIGQ